MTCQLILNADDFGWSVGVNEAVCALYDAGVVTSTSLMVGGRAAADAVERLAARPGLAAGLHAALVCAPALLPRVEVEHLVDGDGMLPDNCLRAGLLYTAHPAWRREMGRELDAQFRRFDALRRDLGRDWSHVDAHVHFALTPAVFERLLACCRQYPIIGFRIPEDDPAWYQQFDAEDARRQRWLARHFRLFCGVQRRALAASRYVIPARCYGLFRSGRLDIGYLCRLTEALPDGLSELHCHPDLSTDSGRAEFEALLSPQFRAALDCRGVQLTTYPAVAEVVYPNRIPATGSRDL